MADFLHMGGYAFFVWTAYGITYAVLLAIFVWPIIEKRQLLKHFQRQAKRQQQLAKRQSL